MATPLTPDQLLAALRAEGLAPVELSGWRDRCRCHDGSHEKGGPTVRPWGPFSGVTWHITTGGAYKGQQALDYAAGLLAQGDPGRALPGPLCQISIDGDGRVILISAGRSNHVGSVSQAGLDAMIAGSFSTSGNVNLRGRGVDGNTRTVGIEIMSPSVPTEVQIDAAVRVTAGIDRVVGWTGQETHGHGEISDQRDWTDPNLNMGSMRLRVMAAVARSGGGAGAGGGAGGVGSGVVPPPPAWDSTSFPGAGAFVLGQSHPAVTLLGQRLVALGYGNSYTVGPGPTFSNTDRANVASFQLAQGWTGDDADGYPGPETWKRLMAAKPTPAPTPTPPPAPPAAKPVVSLSRLEAAIKHDIPAADGATWYGDDVRPVEQALNDVGLLAAKYVDGSAGSASFGNGSAYQKWQLSIGLKGTKKGQAADGFPGESSLLALAKRTNRFNIEK